MRITRRRLALAATSAALLGGCSSAAAPANAPRVTSRGPEVSFVQAAALAANGPIPTDRSALLNCGSATYGWLSELTHVSISAARVTRHWGAFIPSGPAGPDGKPVMAKQMMASGVIESPSGGGAEDVPFDHPYGGDVSFDEKLAPAYAALDQAFPAPGESRFPASTIHDEIQVGLLPHQPGAGAIHAGESWPDAANGAVAGVLPGFSLQAGDQAAVMGSWVTDCGHQDFHPELPTVNFMAYGHRTGSATVAHAFYAPYEVAQLFNPDTALSGKVSDPSVLRSSASQDVLHYVVTAITRLATGQDQAVTVPIVLAPFTASPAPWQVCAPAGTSGHSLAVGYDFSVRTGVHVAVRTDAATGCAVVTTTLTPAYRPADAPGQAECPTTWAWLDKNAFGQGGVGHVDIPSLVLAQVRKISPALATAIAPKIVRPPVSNCYPPLTVAGLAAPGTGLRRVSTVAGQVMPFAGWVDVAWAS
jgi:hypothetical protein